MHDEWIQADGNSESPAASVSTALSDMRASRSNGAGVGPLQVIMIFLVVGVLTAGALLLSAAESPTPVDGAIEWQAESPLRAIVQLLCLDYEFPTLHAGDVKGYVLGLGTGLALLVLAVAILAPSKGSDGQNKNGAEGGGVGISGAARRSILDWMRGMHSPLAAAQLLAGLYILWSFVSSRWSSAADLAIGGSVLLVIHWLWAFALAHGLKAAGAQIVVRAWVGVLGVAAIIAIWYYYGRNPVLPAKFPFGNPSFLAECMIVGVILAACTLSGLRGERQRRLPSNMVVLSVLVLGGAVLCLWAGYLAKSRGPTVGLILGLLAIAFFSFRGRWRIAPLLAAIAVSCAGWLYWCATLDNPSSTGRTATARFRLYAWQYAGRMFLQKPVNGHGQGGFACHGDSFVVHDVLADPLPFQARMAHAHNEWLEVLCDLGMVGFILVAASLALTIRCGMLARRKMVEPADRATVTGLLAALVGLMVSECFGVGLRVSEIPVVFFSIVGMIWAYSARAEGGLISVVSATRARRIIGGIVCGTVGAIALAVTQQDFIAARAAFRSRQLVVANAMDEALQAAAAGTLRLNPQRVLANQFALCETQIIAAERLQARALDRGRRAQAAESPDLRLEVLAREDLAGVEAYVAAASQVLKDLLAKAPAYFDHGWLEFRINLIQAQNASVRGEWEVSNAFARTAVAALERELARQPFEPSLVIEYVRLAAPELDTGRMIEILARPLRFHQISGPYWDLVRRISQDSTLVEEADRFFVMVREASGAGAMAGVGPPLGTFAPEVLRLAGVIRFLRGEFAQAASDIGLACTLYATLALDAPIGVASCYAELADSLFYADPLDPLRVVEAAGEALRLVPPSQPGRMLRDSIEHRMIQYYLAGGDEGAAITFIRHSLPKTIDESRIRMEIDARYRRLAQSILAEHRDLLRSQSDQGAKLRESVRRWLGRATEMRPVDPIAFYLLADLNLFERQGDAAAESLAIALQHGLRPEVALDFLAAAQDQGMLHPALEKLKAALEMGPPAPSESLPSDENF